MRAIFTADPARFSRMTTQELRDCFLIGDLYAPDDVQLAYVDLDRAVVGMAAPLEKTLALPNPSELRAGFFTERRELGILNIGAAGVVRVGSSAYELDHLDVLYVGRANPEIQFESKDATAAAIFYLLSYLAHTGYPTTLVRRQDAQPTEIGSATECNRRTIFKYIHMGGARSCQLVMGVTHLHEGSNWNTMPPHTHMRRSEIYFYFNFGADMRVFHMMGPPEETRHVVVNDKQVVASPGWSIHSGVGTRAYSFCWGMGGENQDYGDMDPAPLGSLR